MDLSALKILILDDQELVRLVVRRMLMGLGVGAVFEAGDGAAGLEAVAAERPHGVICDIRMRPMDGFAFVEALGALHGADAPPVILLSADDSPAVAERARHPGISGLLAKPVTMAALGAALAVLIPPRAD